MRNRNLLFTLALAATISGNGILNAQDIRIDMNKAYPKKTICLQDAAEVEYIPLETKDGVIFNGTVVNISRQGIAGYNKKKGDILLFDGTGKAIRSFNHTGQGPNEYLQLFYIDVDWEQKEVYVQDNLREKIKVYSQEGSYLRTIPIEGTMRQNDMFNYSPEQIVYFKQPAQKDFSAYCPVTFVSKTGNGTESLPFQKKEETMVKATGGPFGNMQMPVRSVSSLCKKGRSVYVNEVTSDIVYRIDAGKKMTPVITRVPSYQSNKNFLLVLWGATPRFYFLRRQQTLLQFKDNAAKDTESSFVAYDRKSGEYFCPTFTNKEYSSQAIGLDQLLQCAGDDNKCYLLLDALTLKEALSGGKLNGRLKAVAEKIDEEDNPVVMVVSFNK